ncbi:metal ABC transporter substrate-binding protein [Actinoplanes regularis]|uniref:metal ABC transporter substrate-binding protein n=1 Tax=Actinoplanes regularis TaxID=52697 RepID=UPI0024A0DB82|nr:metal ABC transporter substrate-binding protein [Actinoplanes regularis]GLW30271.1 metal ABC transporter substrate-binding protein [Actinoplanes regularis]
MKRPSILGAAAIAVALAAIAGCGANPPDTAAASGGQTLAVVATTPEVADFVREIGGTAVAVTQLIKPNVDPHEYEPTPADLRAIGSARVVVKNGARLEEWLDATIEAAGFGGAIVDAGQGVTLREGEDGPDPHIWHDPRNAKIMVAGIERALAAAEPAGAATFRANLGRYTAELDELDAENEAAFARLPARNRKLVTDHDAFGYYVARYGLEFVGSVIPSLDTSAELSGRQLTDLVAKIRATGTKAVFTESSLPPKTAAAIARQAGVAVVAGEDALFGDSLGAPGTPEGTYLGAERHNTRVIVAALAG